MKLYIVATTTSLDGDVDLICDIILVTEDPVKADGMVITLENREPIEGLDYDQLVPFDGACSFVRTLNVLIGG